MPRAGSMHALQTEADKQGRVVGDGEEAAVNEECVEEREGRGERLGS